MMLLNKSWATSDVRQDTSQARPPGEVESQPLKLRALKLEQLKLDYRVPSNNCQPYTVCITVAGAGAGADADVSPAVRTSYPYPCPGAPGTGPGPS